LALGCSRTHAQDAAADAVSTPALVQPSSAPLQTTNGRPAARDVPLVWKRWRLFDPFVDPHESGLAFEWNEWRETASRVRSLGGSVAIASQVTTVRGIWASTIRTQTIALRLLEGPTVAVGLAQYDLLGSVDLGFVRLGAGAGLLPISFDYSRGDYSLALASPRAVASLSFKIGLLRIALGATTSYLPRVFGREHVITRNLSLEFLLEKPRPLRRGSHPLTIR
jgi:hypothetical protein